VVSHNAEDQWIYQRYTWFKPRLILFQIVEQKPPEMISEGWELITAFQLKQILPDLRLSYKIFALIGDNLIIFPFIYKIPLFIILSPDTMCFKMTSIAALDIGIKFNSIVSVIIPVHGFILVLAPD